VTKVRIIVDGAVQGAGYRVLVKYLAIHRDINGIVRNLPGRQVEIFCEGSKDKIAKFVEDIDVKGRSEDPLSLNVEKLTAYWEGDEDFRDAWKAYTGFEIDYGTDELTPYERESLESLELAKLRFMRLEDGIYSFRDRTNNNFDAMARRYGDISEDVKSTKEELKGSIEKLPDKIAEALTETLKKILR